MAKKLTIALAGNANVGKSVIFNQLTGLHQHIGNWPGKTVEKAEGTLHFRGYEVDVIDLPGIYSLSTFSLEELISREYIALERPDVVINVVDASVLERNLFFTLQLIELGTPMVIALNQVDLAERKGIKIDHEKLAGLLGVPVVPTIAIRGIGIYRLLEVAVETVEKGAARPRQIRYGREVEERIEKLTRLVEKVDFKYPARWTAIKLLEGDREVEEAIRKLDPKIISVKEELTREIEEIHGHSCSTVITSERYEVASRIAKEVQQITSITKPSISQRLDALTTDRVLGYPIMAVTLLSIFYAIFTFGDYASTVLSDFLYGFEPLFRNVLGGSILGDLVWGGVIEGLISGVTIALPYIVPFYFLLYVLEDSGYLSRIAFLMDVVMHKIGLHGKAFIPVMLAYGCNVPACLGCRIMETERERLLAGFVVTLIPCAATTVVILGLVGKFVGVTWALLLYIVDLVIVFVLGRAAFKSLPGEPIGLLMEMHDYRFPHMKTVVNQTWFRLSEFIKIAFPFIVLSSLVIKSIELAGLLKPISMFLSPVTVYWLGLRPEMGISLVFGVLRKELTLIMLATLLGTANFGAVLTSVQMIVFALVTMLYIPCIATIAACVKEFGFKKAFFITIFEIFFAILVGGVAFRLLSLLNIL
ncbi:ferrous iron transport protein B [Candidatus Bathyarchaeota archaeon]|nr:ferrous iron transport protein B [Candidatus Bathyarchaeota archaeon]